MDDDFDRRAALLIARLDVWIVKVEAMLAAAGLPVDVAVEQPHRGS